MMVVRDCLTALVCIIGLAGVFVVNAVLSGKQGRMGTALLRAIDERKPLPTDSDVT